jgi:phosphoribosylglycinamide formyltransferase-1
MTFDRILSGPILEEYRNRIINHHPALLPAFPGYSSIKKIINTGTTFTGATCHLIDAGIDTGPIINQCIMPLNKNIPTEIIAHNLFLLRSQLAVQAVYALSNGLLEVTGKDVYMKKANYDNYPINPFLNIPKIRTFFSSNGKQS